MAIITHELHAEEAQYLASSFPAFKKIVGTTTPVSWLAYDAAATEDAFWSLTATAYGSGNLTINIEWGADTATSGVVRWSAALGAVTPETDSTDPTAKTYASAATVDDTHLGTTARRLMRATITLTGAGLDSIAANDELWLKVSRVGGDAADTLTGDAWLRKVVVSYSDA